jgi:hypothetical protein
MADTKISALPSGAPAQAGDEYVIARSGANYKLTGTNLLGLVTGTANTFSADQTFGIANATTLDATNVEVTNLKAKDGTAAATIANSTGVIAVSTKVEYADGTAAAPTVTNTGDTDTGVYFPAANEVAVSAGGTVAAAFNSNGLFFRNRIINGDMRIDQRNAGAAVTISTTNVFTVDRWAASESSDATLTVQQDSSAPSGFVNSAKITVTVADASVAASQYNSFQQKIEGVNVADLAWGTASAVTVTLSFWVRSSVTGTFGGALTNSAYNRSYPFTYSISVADTWEKKTVTIPGDTSGTWLTTTGIGITVYFDLGTGVDNTGTANAWVGAGNVGADSTVQLVNTLSATWYVTGVQLETGSVATPFERRPYGTELMLCQRYCVLIASGANKPIANSFYYSATNVSGYLSFPVDMRATPTLSVVTGTNYYGNTANGGIDSLNSLTQDLRNERGLALYNNTEASGTAGHGGYLYSANAAGQVLVTAEL